MGEGPRARGGVPGTAAGTPELGSWNCCPLEEEVARASTKSQLFIFSLVIRLKHRLLMGFSSHVTSEPEPGLSGRSRGRGSHSTCTLVHLYTHRPLRAWRVYTYMQRQTTLYDNLRGQYMHNSSPINLYQMHICKHHHMTR